MITLDLIDSALHSVEIKSAAGQALTIDGSGFITANVNGTVTVSATDLDIRDLSASQDSVAISDGTDTLAIAADGSIAVSAVGGSFTVTATDLDIRDLSAAQDNVAISDGTDTLAINADGSINAQTVRGGFGSWLVSTQSVTNVESELVSTPLSGRIAVLIQNLSSQDIYLKEATGVSTSNGLRLPKGSSFSADLDASANIFAIANSGTNDIRIVEYAS